jgi:hypothetical protein
MLFLMGDLSHTFDYCLYYALNYKTVVFILKYNQTHFPQSALQ